MSVIDIIVIAVLLVFAIVGMVKGFLNTLLSLFSSLASLGVAIFCAKPVAKFLDSVFGIVSKIGGSIASGLSGSIKPFADGATETITGEYVKNYLANDGLTFQERLYKLFIEDSATFTTDAEVVNYIGNRIAAVAALIIAAVVVYIVLRIAVLLLAKLFDALTKNRAISGLDRAMGLIFGLLKGALMVCLVLGVFYLLANSTVQGWIDNSTVTNWIYQYVTEFVEYIVGKYNMPEFITTLFQSITKTA